MKLVLAQQSLPQTILIKVDVLGYEPMLILKYNSLPSYKFSELANCVWKQISGKIQISKLEYIRDDGSIIKSNEQKTIIELGFHDGERLTVRLPSIVIDTDQYYNLQVQQNLYDKISVIIVNEMKEMKYSFNLSLTMQFAQFADIFIKKMFGECFQSQFKQRVRFYRITGDEIPDNETQTLNQLGLQSGYTLIAKLQQNYINLQQFDKPQSSITIMHPNERFIRY